MVGGIGVIQTIKSNFVEFVTSDIPELLQLSAKSLQNAPLQAALEGTLSSLKFLRLVPVIGALLLLVSFPLVMTFNRKRTSAASFFLTTSLVCRWQALLYLSAFSTSAFQGRALYGKDGLFPARMPNNKPTPAFSFLENVAGLTYSTHGDFAIELVSYLGIFLSLWMLMAKMTNFLVPLLLWLLYLSIVNLGTIVANYGWEWLTLECGFLVIFLCPFPFLSKRKFDYTVPTSYILQFLFNWLAFRLLIGAGMSKLGRNSSDCWEQLTCTTTHYFTQPMPNMFAFFFDKLPLWVHNCEVALTFFEQLLLPFFFLVPFENLQALAGSLEIFFQCMIVGTGNYAWINYVGVLPCLFVFNDSWIHSLNVNILHPVGLSGKSIVGRLIVSIVPFAFSTKDCREASQAALQYDEACTKKYSNYSPIWYRFYLRSFVHFLLFCFIAKKSVPPLKELFTPAPWLHTYDDFYFVSSQGVFGFINQERTTLVLEYTHSVLPIGTEETNNDEPCIDNDSAISFTDGQGNRLSCAQLANFGACNDPRHGAIIESHCKQSCDVCDEGEIHFGQDVYTNPLNTGESGGYTSEEGIEWHPLDFKNLPGSVNVRPKFNSPYHYRLDWEVWIQTTARLDFAKGVQPIPTFIKALVRNVLLGNTDTIELLGTPRFKLLQYSNESKDYDTPPTAIRASFYKYKFAPLNGRDSLLQSGKWYERTPVKNAGKAKIWIRDRIKGDKKIKSRSIRQWVLFCSCACMSLSALQVATTYEGKYVLFFLVSAIVFSSEFGDFLHVGNFLYREAEL